MSGAIGILNTHHIDGSSIAVISILLAIISCSSIFTVNKSSVGQISNNCIDIRNCHPLSCGLSQCAINMENTQTCNHLAINAIRINKITGSCSVFGRNLAHFLISSNASPLSHFSSQIGSVSNTCIVTQGLQSSRHTSFHRSIRGECHLDFICCALAIVHCSHNASSGFRISRILGICRVALAASQHADGHDAGQRQRSNLLKEGPFLCVPIITYPPRCQDPISNFPIFSLFSLVRIL